MACSDQGGGGEVVEDSRLTYECAGIARQV